MPSALSLPYITRVTEADWDQHGFNKTTALVVKNAGAAEADQPDHGPTITYDFYINVDNHYLRSEQKRSRVAPQLLEARFSYALVLVGLALLQDDRSRTTLQNDEAPDERRETGIEAQIARVTASLAPVILPMLDSLAELDDTDEAR